MIVEPDSDNAQSQLRSRATQFAENIRSLISRTVESDVEPFDVDLMKPQKDTDRLLASLQSNPKPQIALVSSDVDDAVFSFEIRFDMFVEKFLTVQSSRIAVGLLGSDEPLLRYEYIRHPDSVPSAHLHVHAHRDQFLHGMMLSTSGRPKQRLRKLTQGKLPYLSQIHFPLGGPRLRPGIEDVLEMLIREFGVKQKADAVEYLAQSRAEWRRLQLRALLARNHSDALDYLRSEGYTVTPPGWTPAVTAPEDPAVAQW